MDFLEIRRKAKERAAARAAAAAPSSPGGAPGSAPDEAPEAHPAPVLGLSPLPVPAEPEAPPPVPRAHPVPVLSPAGAGAQIGQADAPYDLPPLRDFDPPPDPPPDPEAQRRAREAAAEAARIEAAFEAKLRDLPPAPDARFRAWRPSLDPTPGPAPIAPESDDERARAEPRQPGRPRRERPPPGDPLEEFFYRIDEPAPELPTPGAAEATPSASPESAPRDEYLTFLLGAEEFGIDIEQVREVMRAPPITEVPRAPADVLGVITVRGEVVAVTDLRGRLGLPRGGSVQSGRVIIVDDGHGQFGLQVDAVANVVRLPRGSLEPCPQGVGGASAECLLGIGRSRDRFFTVLSVPSLIRPARRPEGRA